MVWRSRTEIPGCQQDYVVYLGISGSPSRSQLEVVPLARTQMTIPARGPRGPRRERVDILIDTDTRPGYVKIAIEAMAIEIVDLPIENGWIFP